jgi:hypothetical protein
MTSTARRRTTRFVRFFRIYGSSMFLSSRIRFTRAEDQANNDSFRLRDFGFHRFSLLRVKGGIVWIYIHQNEAWPRGLEGIACVCYPYSFSCPYAEREEPELMSHSWLRSLTVSSAASYQQVTQQFISITFAQKHRYFCGVASLGSRGNFLRLNRSVFALVVLLVTHSALRL